MSHSEEFIFLTLDDVLYLHSKGIDLYGGSHGVRDMGLVESATMAPQHSFGGEFLCQDLAEMAATYWFNLAMNHGFIDGNKRVALRAADVFLARNGFDLDLTSDEAADMTESVASGRLTKDQLTVQVRNCIRPI